MQELPTSHGKLFYAIACLAKAGQITPDERLKLKRKQTLTCAI
jgi:hypothetical protein